MFLLAQSSYIFDAYIVLVSSPNSNRHNMTLNYFKMTQKQLFACSSKHVFFTIFTEKHLCWSLFFDKVAILGPATLFKKRIRNRCFPVNIEKILIALFIVHLRSVLLISILWKNLWRPVHKNVIILTEYKFNNSNYTH